MTALTHAPIFRRTSWVVCLLALMTAVASPTATAQDKGNREREALRRAQQAVRAAQEEAAALQRDKVALLSEKDGLLKEKAGLGAESQRHASRVAAAQAQAREAQAKLTELSGEMAALRQQIDEQKALQTKTLATLNEEQGRVKAVRNLLEASQQKQRTLEARNQQLYDIGVAVIEMYRSRKPSETASRQGGVLGFGLVDIENISEQWMDRLDAARYMELPDKSTQ